VNEARPLARRGARRLHVQRDGFFHPGFARSGAEALPSTNSIATKT